MPQDRPAPGTLRWTLRAARHQILATIRRRARNARNRAHHAALDHNMRQIQADLAIARTSWTDDTEPTP